VRFGSSGSATHVALDATGQFIAVAVTSRHLSPQGIRGTGQAVEAFEEEQTVRLYDLKRRELLGIVEKVSGQLKALVVSPGGQLVATFVESRGRRLLFLRDRSRGSLQTFAWNQPVESSVFSPDGKRLLVNSPRGITTTMRIGAIVAAMQQPTTEIRIEAEDQTKEPLVRPSSPGAIGFLGVSPFRKNDEAEQLAAQINERIRANLSGMSGVEWVSDESVRKRIAGIVADIEAKKPAEPGQDRVQQIQDLAGKERKFVLGAVGRIDTGLVVVLQVVDIPKPDGQNLGLPLANVEDSRWVVCSRCDLRNAAALAETVAFAVTGSRIPTTVASR
jgi:hypothetical protein